MAMNRVCEAASKAPRPAAQISISGRTGLRAKDYDQEVLVVPVISLGLAFTNEWHGLIWSSVTPSPAGENLVIYGHGAWFWFGVIGYSYLMLLSATQPKSMKRLVSSSVPSMNTAYSA